MNEKPYVELEIIGGSNYLFFMNQKEIEEFCKILKDEAEIAFKQTK